MATNQARAGDRTDAPSAPLDASQRELLNRAATVGLLMRNSVNACAAVLGLADPAFGGHPAGAALLVTVAAWSVARLATRSHRPFFLAVDYILVLLVCLATPLLTSNPDFHLSNTAPQAIAGTAVVSISVAVRPPASLAMALGITAAYALGSASLMGWQHTASVAALYYFAVQWLTASAIRIMLIRVAAVVDRTRAHRQEAELNERVDSAIRDFDRDQLALLHDTAASTLLMAGHDRPLPPDRLAAQARRDLDLLAHSPWEASPRRVDIVAALQDCAQHVTTPVDFVGLDQHWLPGEMAQPVIAAAREAMTNADRHASATRLEVAVSDTGVQLRDDGIGFDATAPRTGHGVDESIIGRMRRVGGRAEIESHPRSGTVVRLSWTTAPARLPAGGIRSDPDRLVERLRTRYSIALLVYSLANLAISVPRAAAAVHHSTTEAVMGVIAAVSALAAVPGIRKGDWRFAPPAALALLIITVVQPALLPDDALPGYVFWTQSAIGWCLIPLLLALPTRVGACALIGYWVIGSITALLRDPAAEVWLNVGLGTASILAVQLFALIFTGLMRDAAIEIHAEQQAQQRLVTRERVSQALREEYQRRYATIVDNVVPLLKELSSGRVPDTELRRRARTENRRLRRLFDQAEIFDHPLIERIRPLIDATEARHVDIEVDLDGQLPELDSADIDKLASTLGAVLVLAATRARVVLTLALDTVEVSVVCDRTGGQPVPDLPDDVEVTSTDEELWCLIRAAAPTPSR